MMRLAIVGSRYFDKDPDAKNAAARFIQWALTKYQPEVVISGGALGIDQLAATLAAFEDIPVIEHLPTAKNWNAYKARDKIIASDCTHLIALIHAESATHGADWTAKFAGQLGKKVYRRYYGQGGDWWIPSS